MGSSLPAGAGPMLSHDMASTVLRGQVQATSGNITEIMFISVKVTGNSSVL